MVTTNSVVTVTVGCCAVGLLIAGVVVIVVGVAVLIGGDWIVEFVVVAKGHNPQLLLMLATNVKNKKIRTIEASIFGLIMQQYGASIR
jgi:hypothetical protein